MRGKSFKFRDCPEAPQLAYKISISQYAEFMQLQVKYQLDCKIWNDEKNDLKEKQKAARNKLLNYIPVNNTWFLTDCKEWAIAVKYTSWGGGTWDLKIEHNPDENKLNKLP